jgi:hypothetical protein
VFPVNYFPRGQFAPRFYPPGGVVVPKDELTANTIVSSVVISSTVLKQWHNLSGIGLVSIPVVSMPEAGLGPHELLADGLVSVSYIDFATIGQIHKLGSVGVSTATIVQKPIAEFFVALGGSGFHTDTWIGDPVFGQIHVLNTTRQELILAIELPSIQQTHNMSGHSVLLDWGVQQPTFYLGSVREIVPIMVSYSPTMKLNMVWQSDVFMNGVFQTNVERMGKFQQNIPLKMLYHPDILLNMGYQPEVVLAMTYQEDYS